MDPMEAHVRPRWQLRMTLVAFGFAVFSAWFAYDGAIAYPEFNERARLYNTLAIERAQRDEWLALAREKGWPPRFQLEQTEPSGRVQLKSDLDLRVQIGLAILCSVAAVGLAIRVAVTHGRFLLLDENGLLTCDGKRVDPARIVEIDRSRWERKSIAVVHYEDELGQRHKTVLDDWVYAGAAEILERIDPEMPQDSEAAEQAS
jgi:hypothetical protein